MALASLMPLVGINCVHSLLASWTFGFCLRALLDKAHWVSQLSVDVTEYLRKSIQKRKDLAHGFRGLVHGHMVLLVLGCDEAENHW